MSLTPKHKFKKAWWVFPFTYNTSPVLGMVLLEESIPSKYTVLDLCVVCAPHFVTTFTLVQNTDYNPFVFCFVCQEQKRSLGHCFELSQSQEYNLDKLSWLKLIRLKRRCTFLHTLSTFELGLAVVELTILNIKVVITITMTFTIKDNNIASTVKE